jgi:hypothetical protein
MKKIYYLLICVALMFTSCKPLSKTYSELDSTPITHNVNLKLTTTYVSTDDYNTKISALLNSTYGSLTYYPNGSNATVTFPVSGTFALVPDNVYSHVATILTSADYGTAGFTASQVIIYLNTKYPTPVTNQLVVLTYQYAEANVTPPAVGTTPAGVTTTDSFLFTGGLWTKIYTVSSAQYASVNRGTNNYFVGTTATNDAANLASYFNTFLKNDATAMVGVKVGDVKYVSYKYATSPTVIFQNVLPLTYDGNNWVNSLTAGFLRLNGVWVPDPTIYIVIPITKNDPDYMWLYQNTTIGSTAARKNVSDFGDFDIRTNGAATAWSDADLTAALSAILSHKVASPVKGVPYKFIYSVYNGSTTFATSKIFQFDGTSFVIPQNP